MTATSEEGRPAMKGSREPLSPSTRRTRRLFWLSGLTGAVGALALVLGDTRGGDPAGAISNSPIPVGIASVALGSWLVSNVISWWWYFSADEVERRANDVAFLAAGGLFFAAAPMWWVAARAGIAPQPDAMILWFACAVVMTAVWLWHRSR